MAVSIVVSLVACQGSEAFVEVRNACGHEIRVRFRSVSPDAPGYESDVVSVPARGVRRLGVGVDSLRSRAMQVVDADGVVQTLALQASVIEVSGDGCGHHP